MQEMQKEIGGYEMVLTIYDKLKMYASSYHYKGYDITYMGEKGWAIFRNENDSFCYDKEANAFCLMPLPSNRDDNYFKNTRFSLQEAVDIVDELDKHEI